MNLPNPLVFPPNFEDLNDDVLQWYVATATPLCDTDNGLQELPIGWLNFADVDAAWEVMKTSSIGKDFKNPTCTSEKLALILYAILHIMCIVLKFSKRPSHSKSMLRHVTAMMNKLNGNGDEKGKIRNV